MMRIKRFFVIVFRILFTNHKFVFISLQTNVTIKYVCRDLYSDELRKLGKYMIKFADEIENKQPNLIKEWIISQN